MFGTMMNDQLTISSILTHAERFCHDSEIVSVNTEGGVFRYTYKDAAARSRKLANALFNKLDVKFQDRVGTLAWNNHRHFEIYYGVSGAGAVLHTINPRLHPEQIAYIINHAEDVVLFVDQTFLPIVQAIHEHLPKLKHIVVMSPKDAMPESPLPLLCYEELIADEAEDFEWPDINENLAASMCYTSGTTGNPKGVVYSHRSTVIHALSGCTPSSLNIGSESSILPVVPMFHVNAWGTPYSAAMAGAKLVLPGPGLDGESIYNLIENEKADLILGVPTVWLGLLQYCEKENVTLTHAKRAVVGGSAAPLSMIKAFEEKHGVFLVHGWGMTEMSPLGTCNTPSRYMEGKTLEERYQIQMKQGRPSYGVQLQIVDDEGNELPHDGETSGRLRVRGPWIASSYYKSDENAAWEGDWFDTGDVATVSPDGFMTIVDRAKDIIKSGGEWISSVDVENAAMGHEAIAECAVVGLPHPRWAERPLLVVVLKEGAQASKEDIIAYLSERVVKWWLPDEVLFVSELPHTATGKVLKRALRDEYQALYQNAAAEEGSVSASGQE